MDRLDVLVRQLHRTSNPLDRAKLSTELRDLAETSIAESVHEANRAGLTWRHIGGQLGIPFQTLHHRYGGGEGI